MPYGILRALRGSAFYDVGINCVYRTPYTPSSPEGRFKIAFIHTPLTSVYRWLFPRVYVFELTLSPRFLRTTTSVVNVPSCAPPLEQVYLYTFSTRFPGCTYYSLNFPHRAPLLCSAHSMSTLTSHFSSNRFRDIV